MLDAQGDDKLGALMIDLYPKGPGERRLFPGSTR